MNSPQCDSVDTIHLLTAPKACYLHETSIPYRRHVGTRCNVPLMHLTQLRFVGEGNVPTLNEHSYGIVPYNT